MDFLNKSPEDFLKRSLAFIENSGRIPEKPGGDFTKPHSF